MRNQGEEIAFGLVQDGEALIGFRELIPGFGDLAGANPHGFFQVGVVALHLNLQLPKAKMGCDTGEHLVHPERLGDVIHPAALKRRDLIRSITQRTDEKHRNSFQPVVCFQTSTDFKTVHVRHVDVEQDQVGGRAPGGLQSRLPASSRTDFVSLRFEHFGEQFQIGRGVVHNQNVWLFFGGQQLRFHRILPS